MMYPPTCTDAVLAVLRQYKYAEMRAQDVLACLPDTSRNREGSQHKLTAVQLALRTLVLDRKAERVAPGWYVALPEISGGAK